MYKKEKFKWFTTVSWNFVVSDDETLTIQPYTKELDPYIGYNIIGGPGRDGFTCNAFYSLKQLTNSFNIPKDLYCVKLINMDKRQKRHFKRLIKNKNN